jgi:DNA-binding Lrp family transcriptional regulator
MAIASDPPAPEARHAPAATRASLLYVRDNVLISRGDGSLTEALLFTVILAANMTPVDRDPELRVRYGGVADSAPDELRRPVSVNAVAQSLGLPFETARRRVQGLASDGLCVVTPKGVYVPRAAVMSPRYMAIQHARYERARGFYDELLALGVLSSNDTDPVPAPPEPLVRAANRAVSEYMLRLSAELIAVTGDMLGSLILLQLVLDNTEDLPAARLAAWAAAPLSLALPTRASRLSRELRISSETVRRHLRILEAAGFCRRSADGLVAICPEEVRPRVTRLAESNLANVQRLFARLRELGVIATWDADDTGRRDTA